MNTNLEFWSNTAPMALVIGLAIAVQWRTMLNSKFLGDDYFYRSLMSSIYFLNLMILVKAEYDAIDVLALTLDEDQSKSWMSAGLKLGISSLILSPALALFVRGNNKLFGAIAWKVLDGSWPIKNFLWANDLSWKRRKSRKIVGVQALKIELMIERIQMRKLEIEENANLSKKRKVKLLKEIILIQDEALEVRATGLEIIRKIEVDNIGHRPLVTADEAAEYKRSIQTLIADIDQFA